MTNHVKAGRLVSDLPSRRVRRIAYAGVAALLPYTAMKTYWLFGGSWGLPEGFTTLHDKMRANAQGHELDPINRAALWLYDYHIDVTVLLALLGGFLLLGLVRPWGRVFPRWVPFVRGRAVPRWLPLVPAWPTAAVLAPVFGVVAPITLLLTAMGIAHPDTGGYSGLDFLVAYGSFGPYGLALGVAAWSYQRRTKHRRA